MHQLVRIMHLFNKQPHKNPKISYLATNFLLLMLTFFVVLSWFPLVAQNPFDKYFEPFLVFVPIWYFSGIVFRKYVSYAYRSMRIALQSIIKSDLLAVSLSFISIYFFPALKLSPNVLIAFALVLFMLEIIGVLVFYAFRYAIDIEKNEKLSAISQQEQVLKLPYLLDEETQKRIKKIIVAESGSLAHSTLKKHCDLYSSNTMVVSTTNIFNINSLRNNRFATIINLKKINDIRGINDFFIAVHDRLPYHGKFIGCFKSKSAHKKSFLSRYPFGLNYLLYAVNYITKRIFPKIELTRELYFWITGGRKRILSKAEVFGRLYCCGYEIETELKVNDLIYFVAIKTKKPNRSVVTTYGPIIRLNRVGKNGKVFEVFKFRTMHPFSEYLQSYVFDKNKLQDGGKFKRDIRINSVGRFMRKYWIDEWPMIWNLVKGDIKLVGVRPISKHYFSLYSKELQTKRAKVKPGLLPPFYADMPKTLEEIEASELNYIDACEKNGTMKTDICYFWKIVVNILFKKARSK